MKTIILLLSVALIFHSSYSLEQIFFDDFDTLDLKTWQHEITLGGGGNWEFEYYTNNRSNSYTRNGILYIKPTLTSDKIGINNVRAGYTMDLWGASPADLCTGNSFYGCLRTSGAGGNYLNPIQSARLRTVHSFSFKYGKLETRAKLPRGDWIWPAIWLLPKYNGYGEWPASGEIDLVESRGNTNYPGDGGLAFFGSTLHWGPFYPLDPYQKTHAIKKAPSGDFSTDFHIFGLVWNETFLYTYLDNDANRVLEVPITKSFWQLGGWDTSNYDNPWAGRGNNVFFGQEFYILLNVAVGGTGGYFPDGLGNKPWSDNDAHAVNAFYNAIGQWYPTWQGENSAMQIDYIKVWQ